MDLQILFVWAGEETVILTNNDRFCIGQFVQIAEIAKREPETLEIFYSI